MKRTEPQVVVGNLRLHPDWNLLLIVWLHKVLGIDVSVPYFILCVSFYFFYRWCYKKGYMKFYFQK